MNSTHELRPPHISSMQAGGKIQVLDVQRIQERLGPKWQKMSSLVHKYFEAAIKKELEPGDTFYHHGELEYLVLFRNATLAEARLKCMAVSQFVCERLFGKDGEDLVVRNLTAPIDSNGLEIDADDSRINRLLEELGEETFCGRTGEKPRDPPRRLLAISMGDARLHQISSSKPSFVYRPFWDSQREVLLSYLTQPMPETCSPRSHYFAPITAIPIEPAQSELDVLCLNATQDRIRSVRRAGGRLLITTPVHFVTLSRPRYWKLFRDILAALPPELMADMQFLLHGVDPGVPNVRLVQELPKLATFSRRIICLSSDVSQIQRQFNNTGVQSIGLSARIGEPDRVLIERMSRLHAAATSLAADTFLMGAQKRSQVVNAIGAGLRYVEGAGMRSPVPEPKFALVQNVLDYYKLAAQ